MAVVTRNLFSLFGDRSPGEGPERFRGQFDVSEYA